MQPFEEKEEEEEGGEVEIVRSPSPELLRELSLVLQSVGIAHRSAQGPGYRSLVVAAADAGAALEHLARYQRENRTWPPARPRLPAVQGGTGALLCYFALLVLFHRLASSGAFGFDWYAAGRGDAARIAAGEWWRAITSLTLHADFLHLSSNLVFGAAFGLLLSHVHGPGLAWLCILGAGFLGNLATALLHGFDHRSVGASTAVFGALGALAAAQWVQKLRLGHGPMARILPFVAAALLLGWQGMGGARIEPGRGVVEDPTSRTDIAAHILGFAAGILLGALLAWSSARHPPTPRAHLISAAATPLLLLLAWLRAFAAS